MTDNGEWFLRDLRQGDRDELIQLTELVLERKPSVKEWEWFFLHNPAGKGLFSIAEAGGRIVGHYVVIPIRMLVGGREMLGGQSMDSMTHPDFQRRGIFSRLAAEVYRKLSDEGIDLIYGFPNGISYPILIQRLGWETVCKIPFFTRPIRAGNILANSTWNGGPVRFIGRCVQRVFDRIYPSKDSLSRVITLRKIDRFGPEFDRLWQTVRDRFSFSVVRTSDYLNWRFIERPDAAYEVIGAYDPALSLKGYIVLRMIYRDGYFQGHILDILTDGMDGKIAEILMNKSIEVMRTKGADFISCMMMKTSPYRDALSRCGFVFRPKRIPFTVITFLGRVSKELLDNRENWYVTLGDSDFV